MSRENTYHSIILKKQPYGEGDEIITVFTQESGKLRFMGKSTKLAKSKLQYSLQTLFLVKLTATTSSSLGKIIGAEVLQTFANIRENLACMNAAFFALELLIKFTPDEQKNEQLYTLFITFFGFLNSLRNRDNVLDVGLAKFKIQFLKDLGFAIGYPSAAVKAASIGFSNSRGGFVENSVGADSVPVKTEIFDQFIQLQKISFDDILTQISQTENVPDKNLAELNQLLNNFIRYQLERDIKSERFLKL